MSSVGGVLVPILVNQQTHCLGFLVSVVGAPRRGRNSSGVEEHQLLEARLLGCWVSGGGCYILGVRGS